MSLYNISNYFFLSRFPKDQELRDQWVAAMRRENYTPSKSAVLCSIHFLEQDLDRTSLCVVRVREGAIPKVFEAFPPLKRNTSQRKPPVKRLKLEPSTSKVTEPAIDSPSKLDEKTTHRSNEI